MHLILHSPVSCSRQQIFPCVFSAWGNCQTSGCAGSQLQHCLDLNGAAMGQIWRCWQPSFNCSDFYTSLVETGSFKHHAMLWFWGWTPLWDHPLPATRVFCHLQRVNREIVVSLLRIKPEMASHYSLCSKPELLHRSCRGGASSIASSPAFLGSSPPTRGRLGDYHCYSVSLKPTNYPWKFHTTKL